MVLHLAAPKGLFSAEHHKGGRFLVLVSFFARLDGAFVNCCCFRSESPLLIAKHHFASNRLCGDEGEKEWDGI